MGTLIPFPEQPQGMRIDAKGESRGEPATVIILPVVRIEHYDDEQAEDAAPPTGGARSRSSRKRRRRASRS
jgi:hypothetical protein